MADFDPDAYLKASSEPAFDPDAYLGHPEPADHGLSERQKLSPLEKAISPITSYPETYSRMNQEARDTVTHGKEQIGKGELLKGAGNMALGSLDYVASPVNAAYRSVIGQPLEDVTGIPREYTEFAAQMATPGLGFGKQIIRKLTGASGLPPAVTDIPKHVPVMPEPNGPLGVTLSEGQATRDMEAIRRESQAQTGQLGPVAERDAREFHDQQAGQTAAARESVERSMDPQGGQILAESPHEAAGTAADSFRREAAREKANVTAAYDEAKALPGEVTPSAVLGMGNRIKLNLPDSVVVDPQLTPFASKMIDAIDETISKLRIPNKAEFAEPDRTQIAGVSLRGLDQIRKKLSEFRRGAFANSPTDGRAAQAIIDAYDSHIDKAINSGQFRGDPRAVNAWNAARAAHTDYMKTFGKQSNDPVGRVIQKIIGDKVNPPAVPNTVADYLFGASGINPSELNVRVAERFKKVLGENSPEWAAIRQGLFSRLIEPSGDAKGATMTAKRLEKFLTSDGVEMAKTVFTPEQRAMMQKYVDLQRALEIPRGGYNSSHTAPFLARSIDKVREWVARGVGAAIGHVIAPHWHGVGEAVGAVIAGKSATMMENWQNAKKIADQMPILERQIKEWRKAVSRPNGNEKLISTRTAALASSFEKMGIDTSVLRQLQGTVPSAADQQQGSGRGNDQPNQGQTGKAHGGSVITGPVRRAFAGGGDVYDEVAPIDWSQMNRTTGELRNYDAKPTERLHDYALNTMIDAGVPKLNAQHLVSGVGNVLMASPAGIPGIAADLVYDKARGNNMGVVEGMAGLLPGVGPEARSAVAESGPIWRSAVEDAVNNLPMKAGTVKQWLNKIMGQPNVRKDLPEIERLAGLPENQTLSREDVLGHVQEAKPQMTDVRLGEREYKDLTPEQQANLVEDYVDHIGRQPDFYSQEGRMHFDDFVQSRLETYKDDYGGTKYGSYTLPGGEGYREHLITLPTNSNKEKAVSNKISAYSRQLREKYGHEWMPQQLTPEERQTWEAMHADLDEAVNREQPYHSSHWSEPNVLLHMRTNDRDVDGVPSHHIEEAQSDWGQSLKKQRDRIAKAIDTDFDNIAGKMMEAGVIKKVCD